MSPFWSLLELRTIEVIVTTGAVRRAELQTDHHQQRVGTAENNGMKILSLMHCAHCFDATPTLSLIHHNSFLKNMAD